MTPSAIRAREYKAKYGAIPRGPKPSKEEADHRRYVRDQKRSEKNRASAEKWITTGDDHVYYRGSADEAILRTVLSKYNLWDSVTGNFIEINAQKNHDTDYHGSVEMTTVTAEGNIEINSPRGAEKKVNIDQDFEKIHVSSHGYDHHYYDY